MTSSSDYFNSAEYLDTLASTAVFYKSLEPVINGTYSDAQSTFKNAYASKCLSVPTGPLPDGMKADCQ